MSKKTLLIIAAVAVMLVGATSAYGYWEHWTGWFNSGYLTLFGGDRFEYVEGEGILDDYTAGSIDTFLVTTLTPGTFTCTSGPYQGCYIKLWPGASGSKPTGQRGQKEVNPGATWTGYAILYIPDPPNPTQTVEFDSVWGTWNTTSEPGDCFNYWGIPHIYSAHWYVGGSRPLGLGGRGGSEGELLPE